jgi:hypothetical protein
MVHMIASLLFPFAESHIKCLWVFEKLRGDTSCCNVGLPTRGQRTRTNGKKHLRQQGKNKIDVRLFFLQDVLKLVDDIFAAVSALHAAGLVHKDVRIPNILYRKEPSGQRTYMLFDLEMAAKMGDEMPEDVRTRYLLLWPHYTTYHCVSI